MKTLVIYYSFEGNCEFVAKQIQSKMKADILRLKPKKDLKSKGFSKFVWGGSQVIMNSKPELEPIHVNIEDCDFIIIGTPVWASTYVPAINTFFNEYSINDKKLAFYCTFSGGAGKTLTKLKNHFNENQIVGEMGFLNPMKNNSIVEIDQWVSELNKTILEKNN